MKKSYIDQHNKQNKITKQNMRQRSTTTKILKILKNIKNHPFAKLFLISQTPSIPLNKNTVCDIIEQVQNKQFENTQEVLRSMISMMDNAEQWETSVEILEKEDIIIIKDMLKKKLIKLYEKEFETINHEINPSGHNETINVKIPNTSLDVTIHVKQLQTLWPTDATTAKFHKYFPTNSHDFSQENAKHAYMAGYQFFKAMANLPQNNIIMRKIPNVGEAIDNITYIENIKLQKEYENQRLSFKYQGKVDSSGKVEELLLFHGTTWSCVRQIANDNFNIDAHPQQLTTSNKPRIKSMFFGRGIYLSNIPALSLIYGNALILCKVLPGRTETIITQRTAPPTISEAFDSRNITIDGKTSIIHMVPRTSQVLPYCIIQLKKQSLVSEFSRPLTNKPSNPNKS